MTSHIPRCELLAVSVTSVVVLAIEGGEPRFELARPFVSGDMVAVELSVVLALLPPVELAALPLTSPGTDGFWSNVVESTKSVDEGAMSNAAIDWELYAAYTVPVYLSVV